MVHETDNGPDPVTQMHNAGEIVQASSSAETDVSPEVDGDGDERSHAPLPSG